MNLIDYMDRGYNIMHDDGTYVELTYGGWFNFRELLRCAFCGLGLGIIFYPFVLKRRIKFKK